MRLNSRMRAHLDDLRRREVESALDPGLAAVRAPLEIAESKGLVLLRRGAPGTRPRALRVADFSDPTNLECTANKLSIDALLDPRLVESCPLLLLLAGLLMAERLSRELSRFDGLFNVILSYDGEGCALRFHRIRAGEAWLHAELEQYDEEGVLVFEAGRGAAEVRLLGS